ncbi:MAG: thiol protease/hemagglutinin PrtT [Candidatus Marinimicrobia bacterium]|nr:thiol protease/hemagglutinin PrtT [Candidatus Neomarinimicrobiota bacterium]
MKTFKCIICLFGIISFIFAKPVSIEEARTVAINTFPQKTLTDCVQLSDHLYLSTFKNGGFVLSSADDGFPAILAYSENAPVNQQNPAFDDMCKQYDKEIQALKSDERITHSDWNYAEAGTLNKATATSAVQPLISSTWNQTRYYNDKFPYFILPGYSTQKAYVGCVAVVMGQLMNYYEHPQRGFGKRWYYSETTDSLLSAWHDTTYYDYENMPDSLCTRSGGLTAYPDQVEDVSLFLYQCAVSVEMDFQPGGSSAAYEDMMYALVSHYDYGIEMIQREKEDYTDTEWKTMIIQELDAGRPLPYRGQGDGGGHAFLLDGYQSTTSTYFHFNWGWGGYYDGWFLLSALNPAESHDYTDQQAAVFNIHPNTDDITRYAYTSFEGFEAGWVYGGGGFWGENGAYDMVRSGDLAYGFDDVDQWLISPKIHIPDHDNAALSIWAHMVYTGRRCTVYLSNTDTIRTSFTTELGTIAPTTNNWTEYAYALRPYKNTDVYLGVKFDQSAGYITLDDITISRPKVIIGTKDIVPETHELLKTYPNPFNPRTAIGVQLAAVSDIDLSIYDLNGKKINTLSKGIYEAGYHELLWDASSHPSGIYICTLKINNKLQATQKMVLVK